MRIVFVPQIEGIAGKLADAEVHFTEGPLKGFKLIGFAVWSKRTGEEVNITFPSRVYSVNGERRSFALLRPVGNTDVSQFGDVIATAWREHESHASSGRSEAGSSGPGLPPCA